MFDPSRQPPELFPQGPRRHEPALRVPPATLGLAAAFVLIFLALRIFFSPEAENEIFIRFGFLPIYFLGWLDGQVPAQEALLPLVTHLFLHYNALHLITNVGFLLAFASPVERRVGWLPFLLIFLLCGVAGAMAQVYVIFRPEDLGTVLFGASAGVYGLMGMALLVGPEVIGGRLRMAPVILIIMVLNLAIGLISETGLFGDFTIGWQAHAGGFLLGLLIGWLVSRRDAR